MLPLSTFVDLRVGQRVVGAAGSPQIGVGVAARRRGRRTRRSANVSAPSWNAPGCVPLNSTPLMVVLTPTPSTLSFSRFTASMSVPRVDTSLPLAKSVMSADDLAGEARVTRPRRDGSACSTIRMAASSPIA